MFQVDYKALISRGDLHYSGTVEKSHDGIPVGNGTMGSLVWTSPRSVKFQINRVDVYASSCRSRSFNKRNQDYAYACGYVDIDVGSDGSAVFDAETSQHLGIYDGLATIKGKGVTARLLAWHKHDLFAVEIEDSRDEPLPITVRLKSMRHMEVRTKHHVALSSFEIENKSVSLTQQFSEADHFCGSTVSVGTFGRSSQSAYNDETGGEVPVTSSAHIPGVGQQSETEARLVTAGAKGKALILIASAASFEKDTNLAKKTSWTIEQASDLGFDGLLDANTFWWHEFWERSFVYFQSQSGEAEYVESHYSYYLYIMACSSRGRYAPNYGGMIFSTHGDFRAWGAQQWWTNLSLYYHGLLPANRFELLDPLFRHYSSIKEACGKAAEQQWGSEGIYFPETVWFDGLEPLPDDIAEEMRDLYLCKKPWDSASDRFTDYAFTKHPHSSRWNWIGHGKWTDGHWCYGYNAVPPFSPVNHFFASGAEIAYLYWKRYEYSQDRQWLAENAYPIMKGVCEFFRNFPNFKKSDDGKYHVYNVNQGEHLRGATDPLDVLLAIRGLFPVTIKAAFILQVDEELRDRWSEVVANLCELPTSADPESAETSDHSAPAHLTDARNPVVDGRIRPGPDPINTRYYDYDLASLESAATDNSQNLYTLARDTYHHGFPDGLPDDYAVRVMSGIAVMAARLGQTSDFRRAVLNQLRVTDPAWDFCDYDGAGGQGALANRLTNREGANAIGAQRLGNCAYAIHEALCQSLAADPGETPVIRLFPAWPDDWDASFELACRGGFIVESSRRGGRVLFVSVKCQHGGECRLRNPWPNDEVMVRRNGTDAALVEGELIPFRTEPGDELYLYENGAEPAKEELVIRP